MPVMDPMMWANAPEPMRRAILERLVNPPIVGVDWGAGESFTAWGIFNNGFRAGEVYDASSIRMREVAPGVWERRP